MIVVGFFSLVLTYGQLRSMGAAAARWIAARWQETPVKLVSSVDKMLLNTAAGINKIVLIRDRSNNVASEDFSPVLPNELLETDMCGVGSSTAEA